MANTDNKAHTPVIAEAKTAVPAKSSFIVRLSFWEIK